MRIGIDGRFYQVAGPGRYVKNIVKHLEKLDKKNEYCVFLRKDNFNLYEPENPNFSKYLADFPWYSFKEQTVFLLQLLKKKLDLYYVPHFNIPILYPGKLVTAIADLIMNDFSTERGTTLPISYYRFKKIVYNAVVFLALLKSKKVIVPSNATLNDLIKHYRFFDKSKFVLAYEGLDPELKRYDIQNSDAVLEKYNVAKPFLLFVGSMYQHKNVENLIKAFDILKKKLGFSGKLVLVGKKDNFSQKIYEMIRGMSLSQDIVMPGLKNYIEDSELCVFRKEASLFVFPSLKEGFSLTPLEAQAWSLPCAVSDIKCHREVFGDSVYYFNPYDVEDIALKIDTVLRDDRLRMRLIEKGLATLKKYDWSENARITLSVFNDVLKNS
ncbi:glycosyltransferase family 4 protein [candidate division WWE3 bacterium]|nr:glycosyltransferase family 4 protein [candidate division WWE3 bacterium]